MQNIINFIINFQNKILNKKTSKRANRFGFGATLSFNVKIEKSKQNLENAVNKILADCNFNSDNIIEYIENEGTKVYKLRNADKKMSLISQESGFVPECQGIKAVLLNIIIYLSTGEKWTSILNTKEMFILDNAENDYFWLVRHFYKWYADKLNLPGYDVQAQECFNSFMCNPSDSKIKSLSIDEILDLKEAISRDVESINFVMELAKKTVDSKSALSKIKTGGACI